MKHYDVVIIGAGSAGLSARREVAKVTDNYLLVDGGTPGTTCARVGCMPSKVLIQAANDFHRRHKLAEQGISGGEELRVDLAQVMVHVRKLRDRFVRGVTGDMAAWSERYDRRYARFVDAHTLELYAEGKDTEQVRATRVVIATGSSPVLPAPWRPVAHRLFDTDAFFEMKSLPPRLAVVGLGVIGLELGQALHRLGVEVTAVTPRKAYGGLSDPEVVAYAHDLFSSEMPVHVGRVASAREEAQELVLELEGGEQVRADAALLAMGRRPNLASLNLEAAGAQLVNGNLVFDTGTFRVEDMPWYFAGDVNRLRPILHEAADQGRIAGHNAVRHLHLAEARMGAPRKISTPPEGTPTKESSRIGEALRVEATVAPEESSLGGRQQDASGVQPLDLAHEETQTKARRHEEAFCEDLCFRLRTKLAVTFSDPNIATVGASYDELTREGTPFVTGDVSFEGQGRAIVKLKEKGQLHVYAHRDSGMLLGAELIAPEGEHLAHLIAWAIGAGHTVREVLALPFYHPVVEEGLRTALRRAAAKLSEQPPPLELMRCDPPPAGSCA